jgi:hypothetical protein
MASSATCVRPAVGPHVAGGQVAPIASFRSDIQKEERRYWVVPLPWVPSWRITRPLLDMAHGGHCHVAGVAAKSIPGCTGRGAAGRNGE